MRPSIRFLAVALVGWAGVRAATVGVIPGAELFRVDPSEAKPAPSIVATEFPPIDPLEPVGAPPEQYAHADGGAVPAPVPHYQPVSVPGPG